MKPTRSRIYQLCLLASVVFGASASGLAQDVTALRLRLRSAAKSTSISTEGLMPWHLKLAVKLLDAKGNPAEDGMVEEWWAGPDTYRVQYSFPSVTGVEAHAAADTYFSPGMGAPPFLARLLLDAVTQTLPANDVLEKASIRKETTTMGGKSLDCFLVRLEGPDVARPLGAVPTYCLDPARDIPLVTIRDLDLMTVWLRYVVFQGRSIPVALRASAGGVVSATAEVTLLQSRPEPYAESVEVIGLLADSKHSGEKDGLMPVKVLRTPQPTIPPGFVGQAQVLVRLTAGADGAAHDVKAVYASSVALAEAAVQAVKGYRFAPALAHGKPAETRLTVEVTFSSR